VEQLEIREISHLNSPYPTITQGPIVACRANGEACFSASVPEKPPKPLNCVSTSVDDRDRDDCTNDQVHSASFIYDVFVPYLFIPTRGRVRKCKKQRNMIILCNIFGGA
jgi:hypothetical protein